MVLESFWLVGLVGSCGRERVCPQNNNSGTRDSHREGEGRGSALKITIDSWSIGTHPIIPRDEGQERGRVFILHYCVGGAGSGQAVGASC